MKIKTIISLITFSVAFSFSTFIAGFATQKDEILSNESRLSVVARNPERQIYSAEIGEKVLAFLQQDDRYGTVRQEKMLYEDDSSFSKLAVAENAQAVSEYVKKSGNIKTYGLPTDFKIAWQKHLNTWRDYANFLNRAKTKNISKVDFFELDEEYTDEINNTWEDVLQVAENYNADIRLEIY